MNFAEELVEREPSGRRALIELARDGSRREWSFGEVAALSRQLAQTFDVRRGDVVMTLVGNRPDWVCAMLACFRVGAVVLPCTEQLRAHDLALRIRTARPVLIYADPRNADELEAAAPGCRVIYTTDVLAPSGEPPAAVDLDPGEPALISFTSGSTGEPKAVLHAQRYLSGQHLQARAWLGARAGEIVWCTAASGWSKSARNVFIAPWLCGASAVLHDGRFDPDERLELLARERVNVLCMAPTEYRVIAKRAVLRPLPALRTMVAAGEALNPEVLHLWEHAVGVQIRDGYGQTETGQLTAMPHDEPARPGSMGRALPGVKLWIESGELVADSSSIPTFFLRYLDEATPTGLWRTGDRVREDDGWFYFEGRADDVIISAGYRIGPFEVESELVSHPAVAEAAVVAAPDEERGAVVRAVVVLREGIEPTPELAKELQEHVKARTAPYKYPRIVDWASELPKTPSGKIRRAALRAGWSDPLRSET